MQNIKNAHRVLFLYGKPGDRGKASLRKVSEHSQVPSGKDALVLTDRTLPVKDPSAPRIKVRLTGHFFHAFDAMRKFRQDPHFPEKLYLEQEHHTEKSHSGIQTAQAVKDKIVRP